MDLFLTYLREVFALLLCITGTLFFAGFVRPEKATSKYGRSTIFLGKVVFAFLSAALWVIGLHLIGVLPIK